MVDKISFPTTARRFVAYLDIMGFKDFVYRHDHSEVAKVIDTVLACTDEIMRAERIAFRRRKSGSRKLVDQGNVWPAVFSDSILLVSRGDSLADAQKTIYATSFVLYRLLRAGVPLKGALAYGGSQLTSRVLHSLVGH